MAPNLRYYTQSAADFYMNPPFPDGYVSGQFYTADTRLSAFGAFTAGAQRHQEPSRSAGAPTSSRFLPAALRLARRRQRQPGHRAIFRALDRGRHREVVLIRPAHCGSRTHGPVPFRFRSDGVADTRCSYGRPTRGDARCAADAAIAEVRRIEAKYSRYRDDSVTTRINRGAGGDAVAIDPETAALLHYADRCHALSGGRFDLTSGVLRHAWNFQREPPRLPDDAASPRRGRSSRGSKSNGTTHALRLPRAGMEIDFGGVGKEYAADRAATICLEQGIAHGFVNLGGDVRVVGPQPDGAPWRIGIRHPARRARRRRDRRHRARTKARSPPAATTSAISTSMASATATCWMPRTGRPVRHWQSVSVVAPMCIVAGSCATIAMLLEGGAASFLDAQRVGYLAIARDGTVHGTAAVPPPRPP